MKRHFVHAVLILSIVLSLLIVALWIGNRPDVLIVQFRTPYTETSFICGQGCFQFMRLHIDYTTPQYMIDWGQAVAPPPPGWHLTRVVPEPEMEGMYDIRQDPRPFPAYAPIHLARGAPSIWFSESPPFAEGWQLSVRYWFCLAFTLGFPLLWMGRRYRTRHLRQRGFPVMPAVS